MISLMPKEWQEVEHKKIAEAEERKKRYFEEVLAPNAIDWDLDFKRKDLNDYKQICFKASTYVLPMAPHFDAKPVLLSRKTQYKPQEGDIVGPSRGRGGEGNRITWVYRHCILPRGIGLWVRFGNAPGEIFFDGDITFPILYEWHEWVTCGQAFHIWMSLTPMEIFSQRQGVRHCSGKVCIGGYGLGWFLEQVARKKSVTEIVIVEKDEQLLEWFAEEHTKKVRKETGKNIKIICADVYEYLAKHHGDFDKVALDVFESYGNNNPEDVFDLRRMLYPKGNYGDSLVAPLMGPKKLWCWGSVKIGRKGRYSRW